MEPGRGKHDRQAEKIPLILPPTDPQESQEWSHRVRRVRRVRSEARELGESGVEPES